MAIRSNDEERSFGADRERQREVSNESGRSARSTGDGIARSDASTARDSARGRSNRGFASMDRSKQREIASKGGRAAHEKGTAHEFDSSEARAAGRKGGVTVSKNREHMAAIGRRGGEARGANRAARLQQSPDGLSAPQPNRQSAQRFQSDREVGLGSSPSNGMANGNGTSRQSGNSLGGERQASQSSTAERNIERP
ncbi:MAG: Stress-induced protein repeat-containing protein [Gemmatimonadetes bacterium]|jgi:general stress protein YciG|nr:Stress-induced protein repeat-containing protein [Gemmatimonadota bacterium]